MSRGLGEFLKECGFGWSGDEVLAIKNHVAEWMREVCSESNEPHTRTHRCIAEDEGYGFCCLFTMAKKINEEG